VATFLVMLRRSGPEWDASRPMEEQSDWAEHASYMDELVESGFIVLGGPLADEHRVVHVVESESEDEIRSTYARDPWSESHLGIDTIDPWTIRLQRAMIFRSAVGLRSEGGEPHDRTHR
jgi:hypothetical protein